MSMTHTAEAEAPRNYHEMRRIMEAELPAIFTPRKTAPVPLALGIGPALMERMIPLFGIKDARRFLTVWTTRKEYKWAILAGKTRHALDGTVAGQISQAERDHAVEALCLRYARLYAAKKNRAEEIGNPAKKFPELSWHEPLRLRVIEKTLELIEAKPGSKSKKRKSTPVPA